MDIIHSNVSSLPELAKKLSSLLGHVNWFNTLLLKYSDIIWLNKITGLVFFEWQWGHCWAVIVLCCLVIPTQTTLTAPYNNNGFVSWSHRRAVINQSVLMNCCLLAVGNFSYILQVVQRVSDFIRWFIGGSGCREPEAFRDTQEVQLLWWSYLCWCSGSEWDCCRRSPRSMLWIASFSLLFACFSIHARALDYSAQASRDWRLAHYFIPTDVRSLAWNRLRSFSSQTTTLITRALVLAFFSSGCVAQSTAYEATLRASGHSSGEFEVAGPVWERLFPP